MTKGMARNVWITWHRNGQWTARDEDMRVVGTGHVIRHLGDYATNQPTQSPWFPVRRELERWIERRLAVDDWKRQWNVKPFVAGSGVEYLRADLAAAREAELRAEIERLKEALDVQRVAALDAIEEEGKAREAAAYVAARHAAAGNLSGTDLNGVPWRESGDDTWLESGDYGQGRSDAADAIRALSPPTPAPVITDEELEQSANAVADAADRHRRLCAAYAAALQETGE